MNEQVNKEFVRLCIWIYSLLRTLAWTGSPTGTGSQAQKAGHAVLFLKYLQNNGCKVTLDAIAKPDKVLKDKLEVLEFGLEHERYVTSLIHEIYEAAHGVKDFRATAQFLDWFVKEQGEEEKNAEDLSKK